MTYHHVWLTKCNRSDCESEHVELHAPVDPDGWATDGTRHLCPDCQTLTGINPSSALPDWDCPKDGEEAFSIDEPLSVDEQVVIDNLVQPQDYESGDYDDSAVVSIEPDDEPDDPENEVEETDDE